VFLPYVYDAGEVNVTSNDDGANGLIQIIQVHLRLIDKSFLKGDQLYKEIMLPQNQGEWNQHNMKNGCGRYRSASYREESVRLAWDHAEDFAWDHAAQQKSAIWDEHTGQIRAREEKVRGTGREKKGHHTTRPYYLYHANHMPPGIENMRVPHHCTACATLKQGERAIASHDKDTCNKPGGDMAGCSPWECMRVMKEKDWYTKLKMVNLEKEKEKEEQHFAACEIAAQLKWDAPDIGQSSNCLGDRYCSVYQLPNKRDEDTEMVTGGSASSKAPAQSQQKEKKTEKWCDGDDCAQCKSKRETTYRPQARDECVAEYMTNEEKEAEEQEEIMDNGTNQMGYKE
jgi:hypothetical protein